MHLPFTKINGFIFLKRTGPGEEDVLPSHICPPSFTHLRILEGLEAKPSYVIHQGCGISPAFLSQGGREVQRISFLSHSLSPFHLDHPGPQACSCCRCTHKNQIMPHFLGFPQIREWQSLEEAGKGSEMGLLISVSMTFWSKSVGQSEVWWQRDKVRSHPSTEDIGGWREMALLMKTGMLRQEACFHFIFEPIVEYQCERILTGNGKVGMWNFGADDQIWKISIQISHWKVKLLPKMSVKIKYLRTRILKEPDVRTQKEGKLF